MLINYGGDGIDLVRVGLFMVAFWGISLVAFIWTLRLGGRSGKNLPKAEPPAAADGSRWTL